MLGIGSIIAHFVAIRKLWQRKCRSSSVHRGIAHGNRKVKARKRKTPHLFLMRSFLPPCGDKLKLRIEKEFHHEKEVSVPLRGEPSQSRLTPCQLPRKGELNIGVNDSYKSSPFGRAGAQRLRGFLQG